ncbi:MAG TPA: hypothetical protein VIP11_09225, partial [Gemmatimonadaceae bacterium]
MPRTRSLAHLATLVASLALFVGNPQLGLGQLPTKPIPRDSGAKAKVPIPPSQSTTRIKISKETVSGGEVVVTPRDTVIQTVFTVDPARDDSIRMAQYKLDSISESFERGRLRSEIARRAADAEARVRAEWSAAKEAEAAALRLSLRRGAYLAIGGGASAPQRSLRNGYTGGYNLMTAVGFDGTDCPLGLRLDGSVDHLNGTRIHNQANETLAASGDITVWSLNTDLKLRIPLPKTTTRTHFYTVGGIGVHAVTGGVYGTTNPKAGENL